MNMVDTVRVSLSDAFATARESGNKLVNAEQKGAAAIHALFSAGYTLPRTKEQEESGLEPYTMGMHHLAGIGALILNRAVPKGDNQVAQVDDGTRRVIRAAFMREYEVVTKPKGKVEDYSVSDRKEAANVASAKTWLGATFDKAAILAYIGTKAALSYDKGKGYFSVPIEAFLGKEDRLMYEDMKKHPVVLDNKLQFRVYTKVGDRSLVRARRSSISDLVSHWRGKKQTAAADGNGSLEKSLDAVLQSLTLGRTLTMKEKELLNALKARIAQVEGKIVRNGETVAQPAA